MMMSGIVTCRCWKAVNPFLHLYWPLEGQGGCCFPVGASSVPSCFQALSVIVSLGTSLDLNEVEVVANDVFPSDGTFQKLQIFALG